MQKGFSLLVLSVALMLTSCTTSTRAPDTTYYLFDAQPIAPKKKQTSTRIKVNKINLPDYLSTNQLVMRDSGHILIKANYHSWADSLDEAMQRALVNDLNQKNDDKEFVNWCDACVSVSVTVEHFYPSADGTLLLSGYFEVSTPNSAAQYSKVQNSETQLERFQLLSDLESDGYSSAVKQMRSQIKTLAEQISSKL